MHQWLRTHLTYANVTATIAVFLVVSGGTAVALSGSNTVFSDDIVDNQVFSADVRNDNLAGGGLISADVRNDTQTSPAGGLGAVDLRPGSVGTSEVANGVLNDEDIGELAALDFTVSIGTVPANDCAYIPLTLSAPSDHVLLTPEFATTAFDLDYHIQYTGADPRIAVCNPTNAAINDGTTDFNVLVIDAQ